MRRKRFACGLCAQALVVATLQLVCCAAARSHETDQYTPPVGRDFADLGPYLSRIFRGALEDAVAETNSAILSPEAAEDRNGFVAEDPQSADFVAARVWKHLFIAMPFNEGLDAHLASPALRARFPGLVTLHWPLDPVYNDPLLLMDPTKPVRALFRAGTINVGGTLIGTDKIIHFINLGRIYHAAYTTHAGHGLGAQEASALAVASVNANPFFSEEGMLGYLTTGIRSNADLAANFAGLKFYRNLTEEVRIGARVLPPMLARQGTLWRVAVPAGAELFTPFVSPHWNEVLNPNRYLDYVADRMRVTIGARCAAVAGAYRGAHGQALAQADFEAIERALSTHYGEPYGHAGNEGIGVAGLCTDLALASGAATRPPEPPCADRLQRTALWWAAHDADLEPMARALAQGADPDAADIDGETPLHAAARSGARPAVELLLDRGADPNRASSAGDTPLLLAAARGHAEVAASLLRSGADPALRGPFGMSALHAAALRGDSGIVELLVHAGAPTDATNDAGNTALHLASGAGSDAVVEALVGHGALAAARNASGDTPLDMAQRRGHARTARLLAARGAGEPRLALAVPDALRPTVGAAAARDAVQATPAAAGTGDAR